MKSGTEKGQAILLVVVAMSILLIGGLGLAIDGGQLYGHRQMAQAAADAAAEAAMLSVLQGVNVPSAATYFDPAGPFNCTTTDARTPCKYAALNGFGKTASDTVAVSFPTDAPGYAAALSADTPNQVAVTASRKVDTGLIRMLGAASFTTISAIARAAILNVTSPVPLLILHPHKSDALSMNGTTDIKICGGPARSIQVNSDISDAYTGGGAIDLSQAGPDNCPTTDPEYPNCYCKGSGADFGVFGGSTADPGDINFGSKGHYVQPASPIADPLLGVNPPAKPPNAIAPLDTTNLWGCSVSLDKKGCRLYYPGTYPGGIGITNKTALFTPGVYYMDAGNGFSTGANGNMRMCVGCPNDAATADGMLVYNKGGGDFTVGANGDVSLLGTPENSIYKGILFFQDRAAPATTHILGGNGCLDLIGTIYTTNTVDTILSSTGLKHYQTIEYHGTPCSTTMHKGMIVTDALQLKGTASLKMLLESQGYLKVRQVALVK